MINTAGINDTLDLSLGRDNDIRVERRSWRTAPVARSSAAAQADPDLNRREEHDHRTDPSGTARPDPSEHERPDQVQVLEISGGQLDAPEGIVEWPLDLQPGASSTVKLSFEIRHPKGWRRELSHAPAEAESEVLS